MTANSNQQVLVVGALLYLAMAVDYSSALWCVCKDGVSDSVLQKTLDYACGAGADCSPIRPSGACYNPNSLKAHCSYAVNSYFQKSKQGGATCDFGGTATISSTNPSTTGCNFPASGSGSTSTGTTPTISVPSTTPTSPVTGTPTVSGSPTTSSPYTTTVPSAGGTPTTTLSPYSGGISSGIAPTAVGMDNSRAVTINLNCRTAVVCWLLLASVLLLWK